MKTIQLTLLNKPGKWAFVKHLLFVCSEIGARTLAQGAIWPVRTPLCTSFTSQSCVLLLSVCLTAAHPCAASAGTLYRARAIHSLIPLLCSLNFSSTSDCDSLPPSLECGSRCNSRALNEPFVCGGSCILLIRGMTLACGRVKSLGVNSRTHWCVSTTSFLHLIVTE